jgi:KipI family sensor histidine kinase inhibitor
LSQPEPQALPLGDSAITITFGAERSPHLLRRIHAVARSLAAARIPHVDDIVPAYLALTVFYDPLQASYQEMAARLLVLSRDLPDSTAEEVSSREHIIPVRYDGVDLDSVAEATGLNVDEVVSRHASRTYSVDLLGFVPGWAYLSELDPSLQIPRRPPPRPRVAAGSVAIAAGQTGIYPLDTPGGWHIIGSTSTVMFGPARDPPSLFSAGDTVRFEPIA